MVQFLLCRTAMKLTTPDSRLRVRLSIANRYRITRLARPSRDVAAVLTLLVREQPLLLDDHGRLRCDGLAHGATTSDPSASIHPAAVTLLTTLGMAPWKGLTDFF